MLPEHVNIILLSATVPNTLEFADWVGYVWGKAGGAEGPGRSVGLWGGREECMELLEGKGRVSNWGSVMPCEVKGAPVWGCQCGGGV